MVGNICADTNVFVVEGEGEGGVVEGRGVVDATGTCLGGCYFC